MTNMKAFQVQHWAKLMSCAMAVMQLSITGCTYYMPVAVSSTSIGNQGEIPVKVVSGSSEASTFLFIFGPFGDASLQAALEDARRQGDGDTLANVFVDRILFCFPACFLPIYSSVETRITGTLVKYQDDRSRQFQNAPAAQAPIADNSTTNIAAKSAYEQLYAAFNTDELSAEALYTSFGGKTKNELKRFVIAKLGASGGNWKLVVPVDTSESEKNFLKWFVTTHTDYKLVYKRVEQ